MNRVNNENGRIFVNPQPFTCYFCQKRIENDTESGHLSACGSVLEPCNNKCGSYVPRSLKEKHYKNCVNRKPKTTNKVVFEEQKNLSSNPNLSEIVNNGTITLGRRRNYSNSSLEPTSLGVCYNDFYELKQNVQKLSQQIQELSYNLADTTLKWKEDKQSVDRKNLHSHMNFEKLNYHCQILLDWKRNVDVQIENMKEDITRQNHLRLDQENRLLNLHNKLLVLDKLSVDQKSHAELFLKEQIFSRKAVNDLKAQINELRDYFVQENSAMSVVCNDHYANMQNLKQDVETTKKNLEDYKAKYNALVFDTRTVTQISAETSEKLEIQEKIVSDVRKNVCQLTTDFEALETRIYGEMVATKAGRLLWKITDFSTKFQDAKDSDVVFKSPIFYSHEYGYKLRLCVFLNGLKKWKGRHMLACLHVLKGDYDELLKWPCFIEGSIIIRDTSDISNPKNLVKPITAKRQHGNEENEDPHESSNQYIFVPHSVLLKDNFIKNDKMFIELKIKNSVLFSDESTR